MEAILSGIIYKTKEIELEEIYKDKRIIIDQIYYFTTGTALNETAQDIIKNDMSKQSQMRIREFFQNHKLTQLYLDFNQLFADLDNYNFMDIFFSSLKDYNINQTQVIISRISNFDLSSGKYY